MSDQCAIPGRLLALKVSQPSQPSATSGLCLMYPVGTHPQQGRPRRAYIDSSRRPATRCSGLSAVDAGDPYQYGCVRLLRDDSVQMTPVLRGATNCGGVDRANQTGQLLAINAGQIVFRAGNVGLAFRSDPFPPRPERDGGSALLAKVANLVVHPARDEADARLAR